MKYRVNYDNGQVSQTFKTRREANAELAIVNQEGGYAYVQVYLAGSADDPGDWFRVRGANASR